MGEPFIKIVKILPGVYELWLVALQADGTIMPAGGSGPISMPEKWRDAYEEALQRHREATAGKRTAATDAPVLTDANGQPFQRISDADLDELEQWLMKHHGNASFFPKDAHHLANMTAHMIREVRVARAATPAAPAEPTDAQITAALKAACLHDTRESRKDMRKALMAAGAVSTPVRPRKPTDDELRDWIERNDLGSMGLTDARCVFEDAQTLCGFEPAR